MIPSLHSYYLQKVYTPLVNHILLSHNVLHLVNSISVAAIAAIWSMSCTQCNYKFLQLAHIFFDSTFILFPFLSYHMVEATHHHEVVARVYK
jgi:hypothetical protein